MSGNVNLDPALFYRMTLECQNCQFKFIYNFPRGERLTNCKVICQYCGSDDVNTLDRTDKNDVLGDEFYTGK